MKELSQSIDDPKKLKSAIVQLHKKYASEGKSEMSAQQRGEGEVNFQQEYNRQREYLERSINTLQRKLAKGERWHPVTMTLFLISLSLIDESCGLHLPDVRMHRKDQMRLMREQVVLTKEMNLLRKERKYYQRKAEQIEAGVVQKASSQRGEAKTFSLQRTPLSRLTLLSLPCLKSVQGGAITTSSSGEK